jgi:hypothetical protein
MFIDDLSVIKITLVGIPFFEKSKHRYTLVWKTHPAYVDLVCIPSIKHKQFWLQIDEVQHLMSDMQFANIHAT